MIDKSKAYIESGKAKVVLDKGKTDLYIEVRLKTSHGYSRAVIEYAHKTLFTWKQTTR